MKQGLVHLYCGDGKGKTTAAIGLCVRAAGRGLRVLLVQFLKGNPTGELAILDKLEQVTVLRQTEQLGFTFRMNEQQKQHAAQIQQQLFEQARLDEVMAAINTGMLSVQQVAELIEHRPPQLELVMTGRNPPQQLVELSDYVSQIEKKKHPFDNGIPARDGIER